MNHLAIPATEVHSQKACNITVSNTCQNAFSLLTVFSYLLSYLMLVTFSSIKFNLNLNKIGIKCLEEN